MSAQAWWVGIFAACVAGFCGGFHPTPYNNYVLLAQAFLAGHCWITPPNAAIDALPYQGRVYIIEAPLPALLLLPAVALFGASTNQALLGVLFCGVACATFWSLLEQLAVVLPARIALSCMLLAGTDLLWCASLGDVWFLAHLASVAMTLLALRELVGQRRPGFVAFWGACAALSRFSTVLALPVYLAMLLWQAERTERRRIVVRYLLVVVPFVLAWLGYNLARWGTLGDIGYSAWYHQDSAGSPSGSPFALRYLGYELQSFFLAMPGWQPTFPWLTTSISGLALEITSPALILAFFARGKRWLIGGLWLATLLTAAPSFLYYVDGYAQFGMRHALDFEPYLLVLMGIALRQTIRPWQWALCAYSALVGCWGTWYWHWLYPR